MLKRLNILAAVLFTWGLVIAPAAHRFAEAQGEGHCTHGGCPSEGHSHPVPAKHDADHCQVCQLAHAPLLASVPVVMPVSESAPAVAPDFSFQAPAVPASCRLPFSCGPPA